ncbi:MAG: hypothetical protein AAF744_14215, partial [Pseudomonadota bacterium]
MKPNFALSLSFDGISLLHRAAGGWRSVGQVGLDSADLAGELAVLRRTATALDPAGVFTKLLLPAGQIKYLTIDTPGLDEAARKDAAIQALQGATPYDVADLAFDISAEGDKTHVSAVAKETLAEAEGFAQEHQFDPVSFATVPGDAPYLGEPFFGPTTLSAQLLPDGAKVEPDGIAVVVLGDVDAEAGPMAKAPEPEETPSPEALTPLEATASEPEPAKAKATSDAAQEEPEAVTAPQPEPLFRSRATPQEPEAPATGDNAAEEPLIPEPFVSATPLPDLPEEEPKAETLEDTPGAETTQDPIPVMPSLGAARRDAPAPKPEAAPALVADPAPGFSSRRSAGPPPRTEPRLSAPALEAPAAAEPVLAADTGGIPQDTVPASKRPNFGAAALTAASAAAAPVQRFLSKRRAAAASTAAPPARLQAAAAGPAPSEAERMTVFGARRADVGGKPRFLGLILTAAMLVFLAGVAAWASVFLDDGLNLSRLFGDRAPRATASAPVEEPQAPLTEDAQERVRTASLEPTLSDEDTAVLDALQEPVAPQIVELTEQELEAKYAATGIWPRAPGVPPEPSGLINLDDLYLASIDPVSAASDAVALPPAPSFSTDLAMDSVANPAAPGTRFEFNDQGLVVATAAGALSPDGYTVFLGRPPVVPPETPTRFQTVPQDTGVRPELAGFRPQVRPDDLVENRERAELGGVTRQELAGFRPQLRPRSIQEQAEAAAAAAAAAAAQAEAEASAPEDETAEGAEEDARAFVNPTAQAVRASLRPDTRPRNFQRIVRRAQRTPQPQAQEERVAARQVAPRTVTPKIPSKTSVAKQATVRNAINLRKVNLIGVYGKPSNRRALVRLSNGRYKKVTVGDRVD